MELPPLSLYIHIPWCVRKCPYCDFNSHALNDELPEYDYVTALLADCRHDEMHVQGRQLKSIFIGGGTPSLFSAESLDRLLTGIREQISFDQSTEITLEANPGTLEQGKFREFRDVGINRLSIGVQSFSNDMLSRLGRIHDRQAAIKAAEAAHAAGFDNFNLDLMFALPDQSLKDAMKDLQYAVALEPAHISWYQLTIEPNTLFHHQPPKLPTDDQAWEIQSRGQTYLAEHDYGQYEISAYSRNQPCTHNLNYWQFGDYLGIGAGAHGKITQPSVDLIERSQRSRNPGHYLAQASTPAVISQRRQLQPSDRVLEFMMNAMRLSAGVKIDLFEDYTGLTRSALEPALSEAVEQRLMHTGSQELRATTHGQQYLNELLELFLPA